MSNLLHRIAGESGVSSAETANPTDQAAREPKTVAQDKPAEYSRPEGHPPCRHCGSCFAWLPHGGGPLRCPHCQPPPSKSLVSKRYTIVAGMAGEPVLVDLDAETARIDAARRGAAVAPRRRADRLPGDPPRSEAESLEDCFGPGAWVMSEAETDLAFCLMEGVAK